VHVSLRSVAGTASEPEKQQCWAGIRRPWGLMTQKNQLPWASRDGHGVFALDVIFGVGGTGGGHLKFLTQRRIAQQSTTGQEAGPAEGGVEDAGTVAPATRSVSLGAPEYMCAPAIGAISSCAWSGWITTINNFPGVLDPGSMGGVSPREAKPST
jgi:hypothetical protein